tara:strand:+ start:8801 stop:9040 length:240 start_codon:yes stop_codon:yes gene_type:complete
VSDRRAQEEEITALSMKQSILAKNERLAKEKGMLRLYTPTEEKILRDGLNESNYTTHEILMMGFNEEQILREKEEEDDA